MGNEKEALDDTLVDLMNSINMNDEELEMVEQIRRQLMDGLHTFQMPRPQFEYEVDKVTLIRVDSY